MGNLFKGEIIDVNLSDTFIAKQRCCKCGSVPDFKNTKLFFKYNKYLTITSKQPAFGYKTNFLSHYMGFYRVRNLVLNYNPRLHKNIRLKSEFMKKDNAKTFTVTGLLFCKCYGSSWQFIPSDSLKKELKNRRSKYNYKEVK